MGFVSWGGTKGTYIVPCEYLHQACGVSSRSAFRRFSIKHLATLLLILGSSDPEEEEVVVVVAAVRVHKTFVQLCVGDLMYLVKLAVAG